MVLQGPSIRADIETLPCRASSAAAWQLRIKELLKIYRASQMNAHKVARPEGPKGNRPGRQAGIGLRSDRALKARHHWRFTYRTFGAQFRHILYPGLTAGLYTSGPSGLKRLFMANACRER
jgi:hypothetical protein